MDRRKVSLQQSDEFLVLYLTNSEADKEQWNFGIGHDSVRQLYDKERVCLHNVFCTDPVNLCSLMVNQFFGITYTVQRVSH